MNRIDQKFKKLKKNKKKAFIAFITAGDPDLKTTEDLALAFDKAGVDIIELGVPFSDPLADGPTIQAASQRALKKGVNLEKIFALVQRIRKRSQIPIALMTYYNPIFHTGEKKFFAQAQKSGVDGVIVPDLPPEEAKNFIQAAKSRGIATVFFIAPTTTKKRMQLIARASTGFIYYVSLTGVTGARQGLDASITKQIRLTKKHTSKPVCVGFGISTPAQVKSVSRIADGVIVGSAIINQIVKHAGRKNCVANVTRFVRGLAKVLK